MITDEMVNQSLVAFWLEPKPNITMRERMRAALEAAWAADCIEDLAAALRPFAQVASKADGVWRTKASDDYYFNGVKYGHFRRAHATIAKWGLEK